MKAHLLAVLLALAPAPFLFAAEEAPASNAPKAAEPANQPQAKKQRRYAFEIQSIILPSAKKPFLSLEDLQTYAHMPSNAPVAYLNRDLERGWELIVENAHNYHTEREKGKKLWQTLGAAEAAEPAGLAGLPSERTGFYRLRKEDMPITILVPQWGLLQVSAFNEHTESVVIHYKRVVEVNAARR